MGNLTIVNETAAGATVISNNFIDHYMKDANDAQLKVYLYIFRMIQSHTAFGVSDIADQFNHTEREVLRALKYWEKQGLMELSLDQSKTLTGIRLLSPEAGSGIAAGNIPANIVADKVSESTPAVSVSSANVGQSSSSMASGRDNAGQPKTTAEANAAQIEHAEDTVVDMDALYTKPAYSADQLRAFKEKEETAQLLFVAQSYVGKPLSPSDMRTILYMSDVLGFSDDLIDYLIQYCVDKGKRDFRYMEKVAVNWAQEGIRTPKQAQKAALKHDKSVYAIMNELGKTASPTARELEYINRWIKEYGFGSDVILEACARTVLATDKHRFEYADGILANWKKENVHHKSDIKKLDDSYALKRTTISRPVNNKFNQFAQNSYDFAELEKALLQK